MSPAVEQPWLAVGVKEVKLGDNMTVELFNLDTWQHQYTFNAGMTNNIISALNSMIRANLCIYIGHGGSLHLAFSSDGM